jgi:hypothetical protein
MYGIFYLLSAGTTRLMIIAIKSYWSNGHVEKFFRVKTTFYVVFYHYYCAEGVPQAPFLSVVYHVIS